MITLDRLYRVRARSEALTKEASTAPAAMLEKLSFWRDAKDEAEDLDGLAKMAVALWKAAHDAGEHVTEAKEAPPFAASFACAKTVDDCIKDLEARGDILETDAEKLSMLNAEAAFDDLEKLAFGLGGLMAVIKNNPRVSGMVVGAMVGAGVGALHDEDNPLRGAIAGASLGTAVGGLGGQVASDAASHGWVPPSKQKQGQ